MQFQTWLLFCVTETVLCFIPGPAVLLVLSTALRRGTLSGMAAGSGILTGNTIYYALSATGIATLIIASQRLFAVLKWLGAAYLIYLGLQMLFAQAHRMTPANQPHARWTFVRGLVVQLANPKALLFFVVLLPQFLDSATRLPSQLLILAVTGIVIEFGVLTFYSALASRARIWSGPRATQWFERIGGGLLIAAGARIAWLRTQ